MTRVDFYHLKTWSLERALPSLLEKVYAARHRAVLLSGSSARVETLTALLWTYTPGSWLPHGSMTDGYPALQPIWLTTTDENPNKADVLILTDGMDSRYKAQYWRCLDLFDGNDPLAVERASRRWKFCKDCNNSYDVLFYWQQTGPQGGWRLIKKTQESPLLEREEGEGFKIDSQSHCSTRLK